MNVPCPVCGGSGRRAHEPVGILDFQMTEHCRACGGLGYQSEHEMWDVRPCFPTQMEHDLRQRIAALEAEVEDLKGKLGAADQGIP